MDGVISVIKNTISISQFNRGMAGKIFKLVKDTGPKVVMKNNVPECVLLSPEVYMKLVDEANDARLALLAERRLKHEDMSKAIPADDVFKDLGITAEDLKSGDDVSLE